MALIAAYVVTPAHRIGAACVLGRAGTTRHEMMMMMMIDWTTWWSVGCVSYLLEADIVRDGAQVVGRGKL